MHFVEQSLYLLNESLQFLHMRDASLSEESGAVNRPTNGSQFISPNASAILQVKVGSTFQQNSAIDKNSKQTQHKKTANRN